MCDFRMAFANRVLGPVVGQISNPYPLVGGQFEHLPITRLPRTGFANVAKNWQIQANAPVLPASIFCF